MSTAIAIITLLFAVGLRAYASKLYIEFLAENPELAARMQRRAMAKAWL